MRSHPTTLDDADYVKKRERRLAQKKACRERPGNKERVKAWRTNNTERIKAACKAWRTNNTERIKAACKAWRECPKNRERHLAAKRAYAKAWRSIPENRERAYAVRHRRRARLKGNGGSYTVRQWSDLKKKYGHRCLCCGKQKKLTPDHVIPISKEGSNSSENLQPLCLPCNMKKKTKATDYRPAWDTLLPLLTIDEIAEIAQRFYQDCYGPAE